MSETVYELTEFDSFRVYKRDDSNQFFHIEINKSTFYRHLFDYFFSETNLLRYAENISSLEFQPSRKNYVTLYKWMRRFIDEKNLIKSSDKLDEYLSSLFIQDGYLIDENHEMGVYLDKIGKIGEYFLHCLLSSYFKFDCIIPKAHFQTDFNMSVFGIDVIFYSCEKDLLLFGESKISRNIENGINLINQSLKGYKKQLEDEFILVLSNRLVSNTENIFSKKFGDKVDECISFEQFIIEANIKHIGIPIFIAHGKELSQDEIFEKLKRIKKESFFGIQTEYYLITLPLIDKDIFIKEFTKYIKEKEEDYERKSQK